MHSTITPTDTQPSYYDISIPLHHQMITWPGDPAVDIQRTADVCCGDFCTLSRLNMGSHTGTHVDAFAHFKPNDATLDEMPLDPYLGSAKVIAVEHPHCITAEALEAWNLAGVERVLIQTRNSTRVPAWYQQPFDEQFVHLTPEAARYLIACGVRLVGVDYLSVDGFHAVGVPVHHLLMNHRVYILEGLFLGHIAPGDYELICLPLRLAQGDGAPARAILRPLHPKRLQEG
ncbi:MAG: cyclase family protein [Candidatus Melainabacteria bacterium]|nr:cyclase family protein [Candidatus Melainabacteria bacterium]